MSDLLRTAFTQSERGLQNLVRRSPPAFSVTGYSPENTTWGDVRVLVVGAGGIGCEVLHLLALSGFTEMTVIDMDTVDLSNLNRQFLFREADIGRSKAEVAAAFTERRCPGVRVRPVFGLVEDQSEAFYRAFHAVVLCVDSVSARRWVNRRLAELAEWAVTETGQERRIVDAIPLFDTGTEGYEGCCRVVLLSAQPPTPCMECMLDLYPPRQTVPLCTLENIPRSPEHCVLYVQFKLWEEHHPGVDLDSDNAVHIAWVRDMAQRRKDVFGIAGPEIDDVFALGVVKNVVPAVGFTNALVAGQAVLELMKVLTGVAPAMNSFAYYNGAAECGGLASYVTNLSPNPSCPVCAPRPLLRLHTRMSPREVLCAMAERRGNVTKTDAMNDDVTLRVQFASGEVYLMFRQSNPLRVPIAGTTVGEIFIAAGHATALATWQEVGTVFTVEGSASGTTVITEAVLC